ncbi:hypothetical protein H2200_004389 [Cladophialophora chaetospira]|uniref:Uncharacterized protein n=1 Tax=Cladophialophora chaetospira TaxID=386627 RepID=A0AA39CKG2_9EURO|nr:hypothetical protein H2200_004389 [Cladophialophora chaetospira]
MSFFRLKVFGLVVSLFTSLAQAGGGSDDGWGQSTWAAGTSTVWSVSVSTQYVPITTTETETVTTKEIDYVTVSTTQVNTITVTVTETTTQISVQPTTVIDTTTQVQVVPTTIATPTTVVSVSVSVSPTTIISQQTITSVDLSTITNTVTDTTATTIVQTTTAIVSTCSPTLTGLVTCTSRIVNPSYTPKAPLPSNYHWGCPPGTICTPPQIDCNWEVGPPAESYFCSPDECKPAPELPVPADLNNTEGNRIDADCAWYEPVEGYFNLDPRNFSLTFAIFDVYGQPVCPPETTTTTVSAGWQDWHTVVPTPPPASTWAPKMPRRGLWHNPLAGIAARQNNLNSAPQQCYTKYNYASHTGERDGCNYPVLCPSGSDFQQAISACDDCSARFAGDATGGQTFPKLEVYWRYCQSGGTSTCGP